MKNEEDLQRRFFLTLDHLLFLYNQQAISTAPIKVHQAFSVLYQFSDLYREEIKDVVYGNPKEKITMDGINLGPIEDENGS